MQVDMSALTDDPAADEGLHQQKKRRNGYNALHNGRTDSAADFVDSATRCKHHNNSSAPSSIAISSSGSEELLSILEHVTPDQAVDGHSLAVRAPDQDSANLINVSPADSQACRESQQSTAVQPGVMRQDASCTITPLGELTSKHGGSITGHLQNENSDRNGLLYPQHGSAPSRLQQGRQERQYNQQSMRKLAGSAEGRGLYGLFLAFARWCGNVSWSQVGGNPAWLHTPLCMMHHTMLLCQSLSPSQPLCKMCHMCPEIPHAFV